MNLANHLSMLRIVSVPLFVSCLFYYTDDKEYLHLIAFGIFVFACLTDAADGYVARKTNQVTALGSTLDPIADKVLLLSAYGCLSFIPNIPQFMRIPAWVTIAVFSRDVLILIGSVMIFMLTGSLKVHPLRTGKATTFFQMATIAAALLGWPRPVLNVLFYAVLVLTVISGIFYIRQGGRQLQGVGG